MHDIGAAFGLAIAGLGWAGLWCRILDAGVLGRFKVGHGIPVPECRVLREGGGSSSLELFVGDLLVADCALYRPTSAFGKTIVPGHQNETGCAS